MCVRRGGREFDARSEASVEGEREKGKESDGRILGERWRWMERKEIGRDDEGERWREAGREMEVESERSGGGGR